jgi:hypothetical protein
MRYRQWLLAVGASGALSLAALGLAVDAQTPPPQDETCNTTPDTFAPDQNDTKKRVATPIVANLLTSGQPCHQVVSTDGLFQDPDGSPKRLANLQRGFDFYSWLTFIALNSPDDGKTNIGKGPRPGGDATTTWESVSKYRQLADVMLENGVKPTWGARVVPRECKALDDGKKMILKLGEAAWNQPFKTGPLIDQNGNYALFDILMNRPMFEFINDNGLYSREGQERFHQDIVFPFGVNTSTTPPAPNGNERIGKGKMGSVMIKVSWRILDPEKDKALMGKFHTVDALVYFPGPPPDKIVPPGTRAGPACVAKTLGMIGFHVGHKTRFAPQWAWSTFEHVANAPDREQVTSNKLTPPYNFYKPNCKDCLADNLTPPDPWDPPVSLKFHSDKKSQVVREKMLPDDVLEEVAALNKDFRALLKGTVWENYLLLATQWPSDAASTTDCNGAPAPTFLANTTLETYSQADLTKVDVPLATSSCMACHGNATTQHVPATASDFTFILEKAQCENGRCGPRRASVLAKPFQAQRCGLANPPTHL